MGTKVQCKSYQHGFYSMKDPNEGNNNWPLYYEHEALNWQFCTVSKQCFINGYTEYEKEVLRRTILTHEATFRKQVHELHRLYSTQRKLMDEFKRKEQCGYSLREHVVLPSPFSSYIPQNGVAKQFSWSSSLPASRVSYGTIFVDNVDRIDAIHNNEPSKCESRNALHNNESSKCESREGSKILIDLRLPAEAYSDNEVTKNINKDWDDRSKRLLDLNEDPEPENAAKTRYASDEGSTCRKSRKVDLQSKNSADSHSLVDLNEPIEEESYDEAGVASLSNAPCSRAFHVKTWNKLSLKPDSTLLNHQDLLQNNGCEDSSLTFLHVKEKEEVPGWQFSSDQFEHLQTGKSNSCPHSISSRRMSSSSDQLKLHNELSWSSLSSQNYVSSWLKDKRPIDNEHGKLSSSTNSWMSAPTSGTFSIIPRFDNCSMPSTSDSSCMKSVHKMSHITDAAQTLSCFSNRVPSHEGSRSSHDKRKYSGSLRSQQSSENEASCKNGFPCNSQLDYRTPNLDSPKVGFDMPNISNSASFYHGKFEDDAAQKHSEGFNAMNVMSAKDVTPKPLCADDSQDGCAKQQSYIDDSNCALSRGMSWLTSSRVCNESINLNVAVGCDPGVVLNYSQTTSNDGVVPGGKEAANCPFKDVLHSRNKMNEVSGIPNDKSHVGSSFIDLNLNCTQTSPTMYFEEKSANMIANDINSAAASMDQHAHSVSVDNGLGSQPKLAVTSVSPKATSEIDLEAPIISHSDGNMLSGGTNHPFTTSEIPSSQPEIGKEYERVETAITAAEILVSMSATMLRKHSDSNASQPSALASEDTLIWFADIITSSVEVAETAGSALKGGGDEYGRSEHNGMDFFESMTLKLKEMKAEDFWSQPLVLEHQEEGPGVAFLLQPKFRRGQVRRRRQKRDFQKDILPGLATLSRHEVTEDLQAIGGLMKATGQAWQMGSGKRSGGRKGRSCRGGRWQQQGSTEVAETPVESPPLKPSNSELENDGSGMIGWGRTRRCRRQRCPSGNVTMHPPLT